MRPEPITYTWVGLDANEHPVTQPITITADTYGQISREARKLMEQHGCATYRLAGFRYA